MVETALLLIGEGAILVFLLLLFILIISKSPDKHSPRHVRDDVQRIKAQLMVEDKEF